jgi:hypothetical protein
MLMSLLALHGPGGTMGMAAVAHLLADFEATLAMGEHWCSRLDTARTRPPLLRRRLCRPVVEKRGRDADCRARPCLSQLPTPCFAGEDEIEVR